MRTRWRTTRTAIMVCALSLLMISGLAFATVYEYGDQIWAEGDLDTDGNWAEYTSTVGAYSMYYPCDLDLTAGLYKGDQYVSEYNTGVIPDRTAPILYPHDDTSAISGDWQGYGWHWGSGDYLWEESLTTYDPPLDEKSGAGLTGVHPSTLKAVVDDPDSWIYCLDMNPGEAKTLLGKTKAVKLDVLYRRTLFPQQMKSGDYCPFLLVSRSGTAAKVVFPKPDGSATVVSVEWGAQSWSVLDTESIK